MAHHQDPSPVNPLPPVVVLLFLAIAVPEAAFSLGAQGLLGGSEGVGWRLAAVERFGFSGDIFDWMAANGRWLPEHMLRFLSYPFVHGSFSAALFAAVLMLAMGKLIGEVIGQLAVVVIFVGAGVFGALIYALLLNEQTWLYGAFPPVYGLIGGYTYIVWQRLGAAGESQARAFSLIAMLMGLQLIWGVLFVADNTWVADLAGFVFGFFASILLAPGGWARFIILLRRN